MANLAYPGDDQDQDLALALRLSQLPFDDSDEQIAQLPPESYASANHGSHSNAPISEEDDLAAALSLSLISSDDLDKQVAPPHSTGSAPAGEEIPLSITPNESDTDSLDLALILSQLPADVFDEQVSGLNGRAESRMVADGSPASRFFIEVWSTRSLYICKPLKIAPG